MAETGEDKNRWRSRTASRVITSDAHGAGFLSVVGVVMEADRSGKRQDADLVVDDLVRESRHFARTVKNLDALEPAIQKVVEAMESRHPGTEASRIFEQAMHAYKDAVEKHLGIDVADRSGGRNPAS